MKVLIYKNKKIMGQEAAKHILKVLKDIDNPVLGLATGSTPLETYKELINDYKKNNRDWSNVTTYNLDEYAGIESNNQQSYAHFMKEKLFNHININPANTHVPSGTGQLNKVAKEYDNEVRNAGIDIQLLGIGTNGHIAFNEPGTSWDSITHVVTLDGQTRKDNSRNFHSIDDVPTHAVSMGISTILKAHKIVLLASGVNKADAIAALVEGNPNINWPCTALKQHHDVVVIIDEDAASKLKNKYNQE